MSLGIWFRHQGGGDDEECVSGSEEVEESVGFAVQTKE